ncbi:MAG: hypothetical protein ABS46_13375 [Cytophagaceae bacterium SCN 52-12]|nr:MAG: hypothetical protein ABS46_13375 [Cytophagaceae bacterium SCN 52-12]
MIQDGLTVSLRRSWNSLPKKSKEIWFFAFLAGITWIIGKYIAIGPYTNDNALVTNLLCLMFLFQTIGLYALFARWVFPRFLYKKRVVGLLLYLILSFLLVYWINYFTISQLIHISQKTTPEGTTAWIVRIWQILSKAGWMGCFTDSIVAFWNYGFSCEVASIYLLVKIAGDILLHRENRQKLERDNMVLELDFLKSKINPHFLFNTLNSIYARTVEVNEEASDLILKLAELMRYSLYRTGKERVLLSDELKYVENYIDLEKCRYDKVVNISFDTDGATREYQIAPLLLITLVENAFKHGVNRNNTEDCFVRISALIEDDMLYFSVENSLAGSHRQGIRSHQSETEGGLGLTTLKRRLSLLYPGSHHFVSNAFENYYEAMLHIPLERAGVISQS